MESTLSDLTLATPYIIINSHMVPLPILLLLTCLCHCDLSEFHINSIVLDHGFILHLNPLCQSLCLSYVLGHLHLR